MMLAARLLVGRTQFRPAAPRDEIADAVNFLGRPIRVQMTAEDRAHTQASWDWREVAASVVVMVFIIGAYLYFRG